MPKGNSGIKRGVLRKVDRQMKQDAARGVISMSITKGLNVQYANAVYELVDKNYPMLEGYRYQDLGIGGYNYYLNNVRVNSWHEPFPKYITTESGREGFVKLQIYGHAGKVEQ